MPLAKQPPQRWGPEPLPVGTQVMHKSRGWVGTVQRYDPKWSVGQFPVRWPGGHWESCTADYLQVLPD